MVAHTEENGVGKPAQVFLQAVIGSSNINRAVCKWGQVLDVEGNADLAVMSIPVALAPKMCLQAITTTSKG